MDVKLQANGLVVCIVRRFVDELVTYGAAFQQRLALLEGARVRAVEKVKEAADDAGKSAARVRLDVTLKAPVIIVPRNASSLECLVVDLGLITVRNRFRLVSDRPGHPTAYTDHMQLQLAAVQLLIGHVDTDAPAKSGTVVLACELCCLAR